MRVTLAGDAKVVSVAVQDPGPRPRESVVDGTVGGQLQHPVQASAIEVNSPQRRMDTGAVVGASFENQPPSRWGPADATNEVEPRPVRQRLPNLPAPNRHRDQDRNTRA